MIASAAVRGPGSGVRGRWVLGPSLLLALAFGAEATAADTPFSGTIVVVEEIEGETPGRQEKDELEHYAEIVRSRLDRLRGELATAPPVVAQVLTEDAAALRSELSRIALGGGGALRLSTTTYQLSQGRIRVSGGDLQLLVDRNRRTVQALSGGQVQTLTLAESTATPPGAPIGEAAEPFDSHPTIRQSFQLGPSSYVARIAPDLPNPYALTLFTEAPADSLSARLASLPGLPVLVETRDGKLVRRQRVLSVTAGEISDQAFRPWR